MIYSLQGLRVILIFLVFLFHMNSSSGSDFLLFKGFGSLAVSYFFILSGFVHLFTFKEDASFEENKKKTISRIIRNYPLHWICLFLMILLRRKSLSISLSSFLRIFVNASLLQSWIPNKEVCLDFNGASWFLSAIIFMLLMTAPLCKIASRLKKKNQILLGFTGIQIIEILFSAISYGRDPECIIYFNPLIRLLDYFAGMLTAQFVKNYGRTYKLNHILETFCFLMIFVISMTYTFLPHSFVHCGTAYLLIGCFTIYCFATQNGYISKVLSMNFFKKLSKGTMFFYMVHQVVNFYFLGFLLHFKKSVNYGIYYTVVGGGSLVAAFVLYKIFQIWNRKQAHKNVIIANN